MARMNESRFGCLRKLDVLSSQEILTAASNLVEVYILYKDDLDVSLGNELVQFADFVDAFKDEQADDVSREHFMYQLIHKKRVQESFPTVEIALLHGAYDQQLQRVHSQR